MKKRKILVFLGHPDKETKGGSFADAYEEGARAAGHEVKRINLGELSFDPILHKGYKVIQNLEPDLATAQEAIRWCDHFVVIYPSWWSTMPSLLKGFFDRAWLPHFAFHFSENGMSWKKLLKGRSASVFVTSDSHPLLARLIFGDTTNEIRKGILWFAGFSPISIHKIGPLKNIKPPKLLHWQAKFRAWGRVAK
jgi:NAD(P)H dehydrogenase (quinone)